MCQIARKPRIETSVEFSAVHGKYNMRNPNWLWLRMEYVPEQYMARRTGISSAAHQRLYPLPPYVPISKNPYFFESASIC